MAPRAYWKGYLKLSLVTCPIVLYPASSQADKIHFHQINRKTGHRLRQEMVDEKSGRAVEKEDKGRGYELSKGRYVEIEPEELKAIQLVSTHTIDIDTFVPADEIDKRYYDHPYYIVPNGKAGADAFAVIRDAMRDKGRVALARIVITNREHVMALEPLDKGMLGTTLRYDYEVRDEKDYFKDVTSPKVPKEMVRIASHILDTKAGHFNPSKFKDEYENALKKLVKRKASGKPIELPDEAPEESNVINLMDALKRSIAAGSAKKKRAKARSRKSRPPKAA
jgi:DNA end-binding protein Ku